MTTLYFYYNEPPCTCHQTEKWSNRVALCVYDCDAGEAEIAIPDWAGRNLLYIYVTDLTQSVQMFGPDIYRAIKKDVNWICKTGTTLNLPHIYLPRVTFFKIEESLALSTQPCYICTSVGEYYEDEYSEFEFRNQLFHRRNTITYLCNPITRIVAHHSHASTFIIGFRF